MTSTPTILPPPGATGEQDTPLRATGEQALCLRGIRQINKGLAF